MNKCSHGLSLLPAPTAPCQHHADGTKSEQRPAARLRYFRKQIEGLQPDQWSTWGWGGRNRIAALRVEQRRCTVTAQASGNCSFVRRTKPRVPRTHLEPRIAIGQ